MTAHRAVPPLAPARPWQVCALGATREGHDHKACLTAFVDSVTDAEKARGVAARRYIHRALHTGRGFFGNVDEWCVADPQAGALVLALRLFDDRPRDAAGARLVLHDAVCASGCDGDDAAEHARTQADTVRVLRCFHAAETTRGVSA